jgi:hypothetical protein
MPQIIARRFSAIIHPIVGRIHTATMSAGEVTKNQVAACCYSGTPGLPFIFQGSNYEVFFSLAVNSIYPSRSDQIPSSCKCILGRKSKRGEEVGFWRRWIMPRVVSHLRIFLLNFYKVARLSTLARLLAEKLSLLFLPGRRGP